MSDVINTEKRNTKQRIIFLSTSRNKVKTMDLRECLKILANRQASSIYDEHGCPCCKLPNTCTSTIDSSDKRGEILEDSTFNEASILSLIDALLHVQETRVKVSNMMYILCSYAV